MVGDSTLFSVPTVICGCLSVIASSYVCISAIRGGYTPCKPLITIIPKLKYRRHKKKIHSHPFINSNDKNNSLQNTSSNMTTPHQKLNNQHGTKTERYHPTMMVDILFWMCFTDCLHAMEIMINWAPLAFGFAFWNGTECEVLAVFGQFFAIQSPCWHCLLAYNLGYLLLGGSMSKLFEQRKWQFLFVNIIPLIATALPLIYHKYGPYYNNKKYNDAECWINQENWQIMYVVAIVLSLIFHYIVIVIAMLKWKHYSSVGFDSHFKFVVIKLLRFIVIYTIVRFFPVMERIWEFMSPKPPPEWLIISHHVSVALLGFANAVIWTVNQKQIPYTKSYTTLKDAENDKNTNKRQTKIPYGYSRRNTSSFTVETTDCWNSVYKTQKKDHFRPIPPTGPITPENGVCIPKCHLTITPGKMINLDMSSADADPESALLWSLDDG